jgi:hypothetical protein
MGLGFGRGVRLLAAAAVFLALLSSTSRAVPQPRILPLLQSGPLIPELVGYWKLDEPDGATQALDSSGYNNHGQYRGTTSSALKPAMNNYACNAASRTFSNANGGTAVVVPDHPTLSFTGSFTLCAWIRTTWTPPASPPQPHQGIIEKWGDGGGYMVRLLGSEDVSFGIFDSTGFETIQTTPRKPAVNEWYHVSAVYTQGGNGLMQIWHNNAAGSYPAADRDPDAYDSTDAGLTVTGPLDSAMPLLIGDAQGAHFFEGQIDEVRLYNRALTGPEIMTVRHGQPAVATLSATPGPGYIDLAWTAAAGSAQYAVYQSLSATGPFVRLATTNALTYRDTSATGTGATYYYQVTAVSVVESCPAGASASPLSGTPPPPPVPRTNDHEEGFLDGGNCGCGTTRLASPAAALLMILALLASAFRR